MTDQMTDKPEWVVSDAQSAACQRTQDDFAYFKKMIVGLDDILHVLDGLGERRPNVEEIGFGVAVKPDSTGSWFPFERGEVYLVDLTREDEQVVMGYEFGGEGRRPFKWDVTVEVFTSLDEAKARSEQVRVAG